MRKHIITEAQLNSIVEGLLEIPAKYSYILITKIRTMTLPEYIEEKADDKKKPKDVPAQEEAKESKSNGK